MWKTVLAAALAVLGIASSALAQSPPTDASATEGKWTFAVQPYLWALGVDGTLKYDIPSDGDGGGADVGLTLEDLNFVFMMSAEARKGNWAILTDLVYADIESNSDSVEGVRFPGSGGQVEVAVDEDSETSSTIVATEWTLAGAYTVARGRLSSFEALAGVRYLSVEAKSEWQLDGTIAGPGSGQSFDRNGSASKRAHLWDGILGLRGELGLGGSWFIPYYADVGTGSSELTWQAMAGLAYRFKIWSLGLHYRYLHYDMKDDDLLQDVSFPGGAVSAKFRF
jgi:opacity protein-like surface antigen